MAFHRKHLAQMLVLIAAAAAAGLGVNCFSGEPLPLLRPLPRPASSMPTVGEVDADFVDQVRGAPGTLLVDARAAAAYRLGHVPGALSLPLGEFAGAFPRLEPELRQAGLLILYCSDPTCSDSPELARRLWDKGLRNFLLFKGGMEEWTGRGHALEK
jgi:rhodanese-related sulfurtransferase